MSTDLTVACTKPEAEEVDMKKVLQWIEDLADAEKRESSLLELSKERNNIEEMAKLVWKTPGATAGLLQEICIMFPILNPFALTSHQSNRVCCALSIMQCIADDPEIRPLFLLSQIPTLFYPFLNTTFQTKPFEYPRLASLGIMGVLARTGENDVIIYFLKTELIPLCLNVMETGSELAKTVSGFILHKVMENELGFTYIAETYDRLLYVAIVLSRVLQQLTEEPSVRLFRFIIRCYLRLADNPVARRFLYPCLVNQLWDLRLLRPIQEEHPTRKLLEKLLTKLEPGNGGGKADPKLWNLPQ